MLKGSKPYITLYAIAISIVIILIVFFLLTGNNIFKKEQKTKGKLEEEAENVGVNIDVLIADARGLYKAFGLNWFWGIPRPWEWEGDTVKIVLAYNRSNFYLLEKAYNDIYRRDLMLDIREFLSEEDITEIAHIIPL